MVSKPIIALALAWGFLASCAADAIAQTTDEDATWRAVEALPWHFEGLGKIGSEATIAVSDGYCFLDSSGASQFLELMGNLPAPSASIIGPCNLRWFAVFEFDESGYVRDNEDIDPDALLEVLKRNNRADQEERRKRNLEPLILDDWIVEPHYDIRTNHLEWGTRIHSESGERIVNYTVNLLGRRGVMNALLVTSPDQFQSDLSDFRSTLTEYSFVPGARYDEYRQGDKLAAYGLTALIVGGAAAAAAKTGIFKVFGKFFVVIAVGIFAALAGFAKRLKGIFSKTR